MKRVLLVTLLLTLLLSALVARDAFMGVYLSDLSEKEADGLGMADNNGVRITGVMDKSPAQESGIQQDDVIVGVNGEKVYTHDQLGRILDAFNPDDVIKLKLLRDGKEENVKLKLTSRDEMYTKKIAYMGVFLADISSKEYDELGLDAGYGIKITKVAADEAAEKAGIQADDVLLKIDGDKIYTIDQLTKMLSNMEPGQKIATLVYRDGKEKKIALTLGEKTVKTNIFWNEPLSTQVFHFLPSQKYIGLYTSSLTSKLKERYNIETGIYIDDVIKNSPADSAGLQARDIIVSINDAAVEKRSDLKTAIKATEANKTIALDVMRKGKQSRFDVIVRQKKNFFDDFNISIDDNNIHIINGTSTFQFNMEELENNLQEMDILQKLKIKELEDQSRELEVEIEEMEDNTEKVIYRKQLI